MENQTPSHPLEHKLAAPVVFQAAEPAYPATEHCELPNGHQPQHNAKTDDSCALPLLSVHRNVLGEGQPTAQQSVWNGKAPLDNIKQEKQEFVLSCAHARRDVPNTLQFTKMRKPSQDQDAAMSEQSPVFHSPPSKQRFQRTHHHLPPLSSCVSGSQTDFDDIIPPIHSLSPYLGSGISEVPSFPSLLSPHSSTHQLQLQRKRALSSSPHSDLLSDLCGIRASPSTLQAVAGVFPMTPNGQAEPASGSVGQFIGQNATGLQLPYRLQRQKTSIEQNQNLDGSTDTTITNKITFTEHRQPHLLRYNFIGNEPHSNLAAHQLVAQPMDYYDHLSPRSNCSMTSHSTSNHSNQPREDMEPFVCLWEGCSQYFDEQDDLVQHIESRHVEKGRSDDFTCLWKSCVRKRKPFNARYKLLIHMRIHSGEKPNKCTVSLLFSVCVCKFATPCMHVGSITQQLSPFYFVLRIEQALTVYVIRILYIL